MFSLRRSKLKIVTSNISIDVKVIIFVSDILETGQKEIYYHEWKKN